MMDLNEIRNRITDLLYGTTVPQGRVWIAIHEIEAQYKAEIKQIQEERDLVFDDLMACKTQIEEARSALAADDNETIGEAAEHVLAAARAMTAEISLSLELAQRELNSAIAGMRLRESRIEALQAAARLGEKALTSLEAENARLREELGDEDPDVYYRSCPRCRGSGQAYGVQGASLPGIECCVTPGYTTCPECGGTGRQAR